MPYCVSTIQTRSPATVSSVPNADDAKTRASAGIDPRTPRAMATIDRPLRHTGLVEQRRDHWIAVDLFPRRNAARNFNWGEFGKDVLQGVHSYVGKPVLSFYGLGGVADQLGIGSLLRLRRCSPRALQEPQGR